MDAIFLLIIGVIAGGYGTIVGAGGGFIFVPILLLIFKISPAIAAGSGLVIVLINALSGTIGYAKQKKIDYKTGVLVSIGALPGSLLGVWFLHIYSSSYFYITFAIILISMGVFLLINNISFKKVSKIKNHDSSTNLLLNSVSKKNKNNNWFSLLFIGLFMGTLSSYLGIGGGWLLVPILIYIFKFPTHIATATSIFSLCIYSTYGVVMQIFYDSVDWNIVIVGGIGIVIGSQIGVRIANKISAKFILQMLSILLIIIGIRMVFD